MLKVSSWNNLRGLAGAAALAGALLAAGAARPAAAQLACYQQGATLMNPCGTSSTGRDYEFYYSTGGYSAFADGTNYLVFCLANDLTIYNVANPLAPAVLASTHIPWDWGTINTGGDTHGPYVNHIKQVATTGGFRYAIVPMGNYGWDFLRISGGARGFLGAGYHPARQLTSNEYMSAAVFSDGSATYAAAQKLDQGSITSGDTSIQIYRIGTATDLTPGLSSATMVPLARVPTDGSFSTTPNLMRFWVANVSGRRLLFALRRAVQPAVLIVDVTDAAHPVILNTISNDPQLFGGEWAMDEGHSMLWVGDSTHPVVHAYAIVQPLGIPGLAYQYSVAYWGTGTETVPTTVLGVDGNLLVAGSGDKIGYLSLAGGQATLLPHPVVPFTDLGGRVCLNPQFSESLNRAEVFQVGGIHYVCRSLTYSADIVGVNSSCISTIPLPDFVVTGGSASATCPNGSGYGRAGAGFPGDTFTIRDASAGVWTTATLDIQKPLGASIGAMGGQTFPVTITNYGQSVAWTPPANTTPGDYYVVLSIAGGTPPSTTKVISLCGNPQAALTVAVNGQACPNPAVGCSGLVNDAVVLGNAGTTGTPSATNPPVYVHQFKNGTVLSTNPFTLDPANGTGAYTVGVIVPYDFVATVDPACSATIFTPFLLPFGSHYVSCKVGTVTANNGVASFQVEQPAGNKVADAATPGSVTVSQLITLKFTGRLASSYTPKLNWTIPGATPQCSYTGWPSTAPTCTISAGTLQAGPQVQWNLSVDVCNGGGLGLPCTATVETIPAQPVLVTPTQYGFEFTVTPTSARVGDPVYITLTNVLPPPGGFQSLTFDFGGVNCDGVSQKDVSCIGIFGNVCTVTGQPILTYSYGTTERGKTETVTATGRYGLLQTLTSPSQAQVTVGPDLTACPCPNVIATVSGPTSAQPNQSVPFSASASAGTHAITGFSWTFGDGGTATGPSVSHAWASAGTYQVRVTATSDCGSTGTDTNTIVIGGGGGGNFTITPSPATVDPGIAVTFTFSPAVSQQGDSVTFNFGDGQTQSLAFSGICQALGGCNKISHSYAQPATYTVTAGGTAGGTSVSGSTQVVVRNNCQLASAPTAAFSWQPTQVRIGEVVQFHDDSTGGPTAWSWNFGGPGVAGSSAVQAFAVTLAGLTITPNNPTPSAGQQVTFTFSPGVTSPGDSVTFNFGDGASSTMKYISFCSPTTPCATIQHIYVTAGTYTVTATGTAGGASVAGSTTVVVSAGGGGGGGNLTITASPANPAVGQNVTFTFSPTLSASGDTITISFGDGAQTTVPYPCTLGVCGATHSYAAAGAYSVTATGTAAGTAVSGSTTVVVSAGGGGGGGTSNLQNPAYTYTAAGNYTVTLVATNCKGSSTLQLPIVVLSTCTQTVAPVPDFDWGPTGTLTAYPEQQQPYAGQQVTLTDRSTNEPSTWHWYDFQEGAVDTTVTAPTFGYTWTQPGDKNVRMTARNCSGQWSSEVFKAVHIFEDVRHVTADFSWSPSDVSTGAQVTFTAAQGPAVGDPTDFTWTFDDGSTQTGASVTYSFKCGGTRRVTLTAARGSTTGTVTKSVTVAGTSCGPESVMGVDAAKIQGLNDTNWHADVRIYNPSAFPTSIWLEFLPVGTNNVDPFKVGPYQQPPKGTLVLDDILQSVYDNWQKNFSKTALRVTYKTDDNVAPVVTIRTYNLRPGGSKYGQINAGVNVVPGSTLSPQWITGLRNNGLDTGFRTNYSIVNLHGDSAGVKDIKFTLFDETGAPQGTKTFGLAPFGYIQDSIKNLFGTGFENIGTFSLKVEIPTGEDVQTYASVMDNLTGDPVMIPATTPPDSPIYVPAIAHLSGEANTVWRSDLQVTNPDGNGPHTWEIRYTPKGTGFPVIARSITLAPEKSVFIDDLVSWAYDGSASPLPADAQTSGIVRIAPVDGTNVYPVVAARSYNLTAVGTFGQGIPPLSAVKGVSAPDPTRLVLTGMSSEDISRTNLGFVNLSETQGVNFVVYFYDEGGRVLNPPGIDGQPKPYTFAIGPGTWDQDKLENRFRNAFKVALPANLRAVTAEIRVTDGGPGFAYASVIDNKTGDPNFIPAQLTP